MFKLDINGETYDFAFNMKFVHDINKRVVIKNDNGVESKAGLSYAIAAVVDGDVEQLAKILLAANAATGGNLKMADIEAHIENDSTDIEALFTDVLDFFERSNCCKMQTRAILKAVATK